MKTRRNVYLIFCALAMVCHLVFAWQSSFASMDEEGGVTPSDRLEEYEQELLMQEDLQQFDENMPGDEEILTESEQQLFMEEQAQNEENNPQDAEEIYQNEEELQLEEELMSQEENILQDDQPLEGEQVMEESEPLPQQQ